MVIGYGNVPPLVKMEPRYWYRRSWQYTTLLRIEIGTSNGCYHNNRVALIRL